MKLITSIRYVKPLIKVDVFDDIDDIDDIGVIHVKLCESCTAWRDKAIKFFGSTSAWLLAYNESIQPGLDSINRQKIAYPKGDKNKQRVFMRDLEMRIKSSFK